MNGRFINFLCATDRNTNIIVWRSPSWNQWPRMISVDLDIEIHQFSGFAFDIISENDYDNFLVRRTYIDGKWCLSLQTVKFTQEQLSALSFKKNKCRTISNWLNRLYLKMTETEGILPGIYNAAMGSEEEKLLIQRKDKVRSLIQEQISNFYDRLWLATTEEELQEIMGTARASWNI